MNYRILRDLLDEYTAQKRNLKALRETHDEAQITLAEADCQRMLDMLADKCGDVLDAQRVKTLVNSYADDTHGKWREATLNVLQRLTDIKANVRPYPTTTRQPARVLASGKPRRK